MFFYDWKRMRQVYCPDSFYGNRLKFIISNFKNELNSIDDTTIRLTSTPIMTFTLSTLTIY